MQLPMQMWQKAAGDYSLESGRAIDVRGERLSQVGKDFAVLASPVTGRRWRWLPPITLAINGLEGSPAKRPLCALDGSFWGE
jgi:hypothetical protein